MANETTESHRLTVEGQPIKHQGHDWKHKEMGTWKMNRRSLNLVGKSVLSQSQPLIMHLNPQVSHLFHGDHICPNNPPMRRFEMYEVVSKHQALLLLTKVKERVSDLARSGIV